jgi:hypothetical protein
LVAAFRAAYFVGSDADRRLLWRCIEGQVIGREGSNSSYFDISADVLNRLSYNPYPQPAPGAQFISDGVIEVDGVQYVVAG